MVYLHNFYLNPMFDPSGPRPGADAHNCTVGYVSEYKPPSLYPGVNLTTINDGDGFAQVPHPGLPRCVCSIESGPCERVESLQMSGRF